MSVDLVKQLGWVQGIRRKVLAEHDISPVPGKVTLMGKYYKEAQDLMYQDMRKVIRWVQPDRMESEKIGDDKVAEDSRILRCTYTHTNIHTCTHIRTYTYIHTCIHTNKHTDRQTDRHEGLQQRPL